MATVYEDGSPRLVKVADPSVTKLADGSENMAIAGRNGELLVSDVHGKYFTSASRGNLFLASTVIAGVALPVNAANLVNTFAISNPLGSGKLVELVRFDMGMDSATVVVNGIVLGFAYWKGTPGQDSKTATVNTGATLTPLTTSIPTLIGGIGSQSPQASVYTAMTLANAAVLAPLMGLFTMGATTDTNAAQLGYDFDGKVVLAPGAVGCFCTTVAAATAAFLSLTWSEWPL